MVLTQDAVTHLFFKGVEVLLDGPPLVSAQDVIIPEVAAQVSREGLRVLPREDEVEVGEVL